MAPVLLIVRLASQEGAQERVTGAAVRSAVVGITALVVHHIDKRLRAERFVSVGGVGWRWVALGGVLMRSWVALFGRRWSREQSAETDGDPDKMA